MDPTNFWHLLNGWLEKEPNGHSFQVSETKSELFVQHWNLTSMQNPLSLSTVLMVNDILTAVCSLTLSSKLWCDLRIWSSETGETIAKELCEIVSDTRSTESLKILTDWVTGLCLEEDRRLSGTTGLAN
jgi:hypothetical protein